MTRNQKVLLDFIRSYIAEHGYPPSYSEMAAAIPGQSRGSTHRVVMELARQGRITFEPGKHRSIEILDSDSPKASLSAYDTPSLVSEIERRGLKVGHIYRDAYGAREFCALGSSERITVASPANFPTYGVEN